MNANTKESLKQFADAAARLAQGCYHLIGEAGARDMIESAESLKAALDKDETLP